MNLHLAIEIGGNCFIIVSHILISSLNIKSKHSAFILIKFEIDLNFIRIYSLFYRIYGSWLNVKKHDKQTGYFTYQVPESVWYSFESPWKQGRLSWPFRISDPLWFLHRQNYKICDIETISKKEGTLPLGARWNSLLCVTVTTSFFIQSGFFINKILYIWK